MAIPKIKATYSLDAETTALLERLAKIGGLEIGGAPPNHPSGRLRSGIGQAQGNSPLAAFDRAQRSLGLTERVAAAWERQVRTERKVSSRRVRQFRVIHLDTSFLVRAFIPATPENRRLRSCLPARQPVGLSSITWAEFLCGPVTTLVAEEAAEAMGEPQATSNPTDFRCVHDARADARDMTYEVDRPTQNSPFVSPPLNVLPASSASVRCRLRSNDEIRL
jgi:hypothetical protein